MKLYYRSFISGRFTLTDDRAQGCPVVWVGRQKISRGPGAFPRAGCLRRYSINDFASQPRIRSAGQRPMTSSRSKRWSSQALGCFNESHATAYSRIVHGWRRTSIANLKIRNLPIKHFILAINSHVSNSHLSMLRMQTDKRESKQPHCYPSSVYLLSSYCEDLNFHS
jgi:hypothetical protein